MDVMVVGIDVSKDRLDVAVRPTGEGFVFKRTAAGIADLVAWLKTLSPALVAIEATGGFETVVAAGLTSAGLPVVVVNPAQVRAFAMALGKRAKTDPIDAAVIAHFAGATKPQLRQLPDEMTRRLADLVARRRQIVERSPPKVSAPAASATITSLAALPGCAKPWRRNSPSSTG
jgi:transposase